MSSPANTTADTPAALGYRAPAEWEPHVATWLSWPHRRATWPGRFEPIPDVWTRLATTLAEFEPVHILAGGEAILREARERVGHLANVTLHDIPTNDGWTRDHGPMFLVGPSGSEPSLVDWGYNAWGGKYPPFDSDDRVPRHIARITGYRRFEQPAILEGGSVDFNGLGSVLTSEQCLLNPNRNPHLSRTDLERLLADYAAAPNCIWLGEGIVGDDTDGHVDELARFVSPRVVVACSERDPSDINYQALADNLRRLELAHDEQGRPLEVLKIAQPSPVVIEGQRMPASYMNFYLANGVVIVPQFDDPMADAAARETFARLFPTRQIRPLRSVDLVWGRGGFHCITHEQPRA